jgi:hypothetical protein
MLTTNRKCGLRHIVICAAMLSLALPGLAAGKNAGVPPAAQVNQSIELLLHRIEERIYANHTMSPAGDSAVDAWMQVVQAIPAIDPVRAGNALRDFAIRMRSLEDEATKAGNLEAAEDFSLFASVAEGQMAHMPALADVAEKPAGVEALPDPPKSGPVSGSMPPNNDPVLVAQSNAEPVARPQTHPHRRRFHTMTPALHLGRLY